MKDDDGTVARIAADIGKHILRRECSIIVSRNDIPHYNAVFPTKEKRLREAHVAVGRTEKSGRDEGSGLLNVAEVVARPIAQTLDMIKGMIAHTMSPFDDHPENLGVFADIIAYHEESSLHAIAIQNIKNPRRNLGNRSVVESQVNTFGRCGKMPKRMREKKAIKGGGLFDKHNICKKLHSPEFQCRGTRRLFSSQNPGNESPGYA